MKRKELRERVAYLQGLAKGLRAEDGSRESEILVEVLDVMGTMVRSVDRLRSQQQELSEYVDAVDQDLLDLEETVQGDVRIVEGPGGSVMAEGGTTSIAAARQPGAEGNFVATRCPHCSTEVYFHENLLDDDQLEITCPDCGEIVWDTDEDYEFIEDDDELDDRTDTGLESRSHPARESWPEA